MIWISLLKKPIYNIIKFLYSVKRTQRHDDIIISTRRLFRKLFSFYTPIFSYKPTRGHHNVVISTKTLFRKIWNSYTLIIIIIIIIVIIIIKEETISKSRRFLNERKGEGREQEV